MKRRQFITSLITTSATSSVAFAQNLNLEPKKMPVVPKKRFEDKVVLITGATSGIGEATAHAFAEAGAKVVFCGRRENLGLAVQESIRKKGGIATFIRADVGDEEQVKRLVSKCKELHGRLDIAFNNAGIAPAPKDLQDTSYELMMDVFRTNFFGVFFAMKYEAPLMIASGGGAIVNCGSYSSNHGSAGFSPYSSSKHAMSGLTKTAGLELNKHNIMVNSINPYSVETPMLKRLAKTRGIPVSLMGSRRPNKKNSTPREVAELVMFLSSPENRILNAQELDLSMGVNNQT
jgi:NAD(P)-dependent dehydrogenase (short-subunit alcohol dehydrogenase family)